MTSFNPQNVVTEYNKPGSILTYTVGATAISNLTVGGQIVGTLVEFSADRTVIPAAAGSVVVAGLALHDGSASTNFTQVPVATSGVWPIKAASTITAGARLVTGAVGTVAPAGATPDAREVIGIALEAIASGAAGRVKLINLG